MAQRRLEERGQPALDGIRVRLELGSRARNVHAFFAESFGGRVSKIERARLSRHGVVAPRLDPRRERQLVDQLGELGRRRIDHLDVAIGGRLEAAAPCERRGEAVHGGKRCSQIVTRKGNEAGEGVVLGHEV